MAESLGRTACCLAPGCVTDAGLCGSPRGRGFTDCFSRYLRGVGKWPQGSSRLSPRRQSLGSELIFVCRVRGVEVITSLVFVFPM